MASRIQQDTFMDESDDCCPLCVEEFDISDRNFRPCPCGYQVCQFCYHNIKNNMNGLCPACRRTYDEQNIEWKNISQEEVKADRELQARKKALAKQKESERKNVETLNRKHLAGLRVVQKNLVYVVGLNPKSREQDLLQTLRGDQYFGQYGKIIKIVVSKAKEGANSNSIGVYVTFARKEDAASCIAAVDGSQNGDRALRAQYGTTKYCSAFLRNETCNNRSCMFLHETGEDDDSFSRQDLSSMNAESTQRPTQPSSSKTTQQAPPAPPAPPQQAPQPVSAASHSMARQASRDEAMSRSDSGDGSALPSSASWAAKNAPNESRRSSKPASVSAPSPVVTSAAAASQATSSIQPVTQTTTQGQAAQAQSNEKAAPSTAPSPQPSETAEITHFIPRKPSPTPGARALENRMKKVANSSFKFTFDRSIHSDEMLRDIDCYPLLFDTNRGLIRYRQQKEQEEERLRQEEERNALRTLSISEEDDNPASGSLQLGGEPDTQEDQHPRSGRGSSEPRSAIQPPVANSLMSNNPPFGSGFLGNHPSNLFSGGRSLTPQQQQQLQMRSGTNQQSPFNSQPQSNFTGNTSMHHHQQSNPFQNQNFGNVPGHGRQASRYNFANDSSSTTGSTIKASANLQQSGNLPTNQAKPFSSQPFQQSNTQHQPFYSGVQGPPPGLKSSGTPPVSGGGMFGQGHGFASAMGGSIGLGSSNLASKDTNEEMMRDLMRGRGGIVGGQGHDVGKREFKFPSIPSSSTPNTAPASSLLNSLYGTQLDTYNGYQDHGLQKQKKKGKKHRHANTSSSGGGGLVNLADPSILQARMHHGGAGQGQFGVQGQGSRILSQLQDLKSEDVLAKKRTTDVIGSGVGRAPVKEPPKLESPVPPGLSLPQDFPPLAAPSRPPPVTRKASQIATSNIKPAVPVLPSSKAQTSNVTTKEQSDPKASGQGSVLNSKEAGFTESGSTSRVKRMMEDSPADMGPSSSRVKDGTEGSASNSTVSAAATLPSKKAQKATEKRQLPGKLDIAATKNVPKDKPEPTAGSTKSQKFSEPNFTSRSVKDPADSQPVTPTKATPQSAQSTHSITSRTDQARTIRVVPVSKADHVAKSAAASPPVPESAITTSARPLSRRPSLSSVQGPGTPISEKISDNASFTSTSLSRANRLLPSKVGTAPVRQTTKAQQKRERQTRAKEADKSKAEDEPIKSIVEEPVQAPIIGRKKKTKKINTSRGTADSTPAATRPSSPTGPEEISEEKLPSLPVTPIKEHKRRDMTQTQTQNQTNSPATPDTPAPPITSEQPKPALTAASLFAELQKSGDVSPAIENLFKSIASINYRFEITPADFEDPPLPDLTADQMRSLDRGDCLYMELANGKPVVVMPDGQTLKHFSKKEAERYIQLRKRVLNTPAPFRFLSPADEDMLQLHYPPYTAGSVNPSQQALGAGGSAGYDEALDLMVNRFMDDPITQQAVQEAAAAQRGPAALYEQPSEEWPRTLAVEEAEEAMGRARKEHEGFEKRMNAVLKKNRRLMFGGGH